MSVTKELPYGFLMSQIIPWFVGYIWRHVIVSHISKVLNWLIHQKIQYISLKVAYHRLTNGFSMDNIHTITKSTNHKNCQTHGWLVSVHIYLVWHSCSYLHSIFERTILTLFKQMLISFRVWFQCLFWGSYFVHDFIYCHITCKRWILFIFHQEDHLQLFATYHQQVGRISKANRLLWYNLHTVWARLNMGFELLSMSIAFGKRPWLKNSADGFWLYQWHTVLFFIAKNLHSQNDHPYVPKGYTTGIQHAQYIEYMIQNAP